MFQFARWGQLKDTLVKCTIETPLNDTLWYPGGPMIANRYIYNVRSVIPHVLPAFVIDIFLRLRGSKPMWVFHRSSNNENNVFEIISVFICSKSKTDISEWWNFSKIAISCLQWQDISPCTNGLSKGITVPTWREKWKCWKTAIWSS